MGADRSASIAQLPEPAAAAIAAAAEEEAVVVEAAAERHNSVAVAVAGEVPLFLAGRLRRRKNHSNLTASTTSTRPTRNLLR